MGETLRFGDLRGMLQYVPQFRDRTFIIAIEGRVAASSNLSNILLDIAALRSLSIHVVLVHGAGHQIRLLAQQRGVPISNADGTGPTDEATLELSLDAITRLTSTLMQHLTAKGLRVATSNALIAHGAGVIKGVDMAHTGRIDRVDEGSLRTLLAEGIVPIVPPIAYDGEGNTLRINSDEAAAELGVRLGASKVLYLVDFAECFAAGLPRQQSLSIAAAREFGAQDGLGAGLRSKLCHGIRACEGGVARVHFVPGTEGDAPLLAELFSNEGVGVMVFADAYHRIRGAKRSDVEDLISMMRPAVKREKLLHRSREEILARLDDYYVVEVDGNVLGSVALHFHGEERAAELACLFIKRSHDNRGYGRELVAFAEKEAKARGARRLFALSTQASDFFTRKCGFRETDSSVLPPARREAWEASGRNSHILGKELVPEPQRVQRERE